MKGGDFLVVLVVLGFGGVAVWLLTRQGPVATPPSPPAKAGCREIVNAGANAYVSAKSGGATQGVKLPTVGGDIGCRLLEGAYQSLKAMDDVAKQAARTAQQVANSTANYTAKPLAQATNKIVKGIKSLNPF